MAGLKEGHEMLEKEANAKIDAVTASTGVTPLPAVALHNLLVLRSIVIPISMFQTL